MGVVKHFLSEGAARGAEKIISSLPEEIVTDELLANIEDIIFTLLVDAVVKLGIYHQHQKEAGNEEPSLEGDLAETA